MKKEGLFWLDGMFIIFCDNFQSVQPSGTKGPAQLADLLYGLSGPV